MSAENKPGIHLYFSYESGDKKWYWHIVAKNGHVIAGSQRPYSRKANAIKSIKTASVSMRIHTSYHDHSTPNSELKSYW